MIRTPLCVKDACVRYVMMYSYSTMLLCVPCVSRKAVGSASKPINRAALPPPASAVKCANEAEDCVIPAQKIATVYYGIGGRWMHIEALSGTVHCGVKTPAFQDVAPGVHKSCSYMITGNSSEPSFLVGFSTLHLGGGNKQVGATAIAQPSTLSNQAPPKGAVLCASEGSYCNLPEKKQATIYFGHPVGSRWTRKDSLTGTVSCRVDTFGDVAPGVTKNCYYVVTG